MPIPIKDVAIDPIKIDDVFRLCYGGTTKIILVAHGIPLDMFETVLDQEAARECTLKWCLQRREAIKAPGYLNGGQAIRTVRMCIENNLEVLALGEA